MSKDRRYWRSLDERGDPESVLAGDRNVELDEKAFGGPTRRRFLQAAGFSLAAVLAACQRAPVEKAVPFLRQPPEMIPGTALTFASTCGGCAAGCGILVKVRDGRPIKIEGNPLHPVSAGGLCAVGQATVLDLYDARRFRQPIEKGVELDWATLDARIMAQLLEIRRSGGAVRLLSSTITSPTLLAMIDRFLGSFADGRHVVYDPLSCSAIAEAHLRTHGVRAIPRYRFERAETIVSLDADFLGTWISPVEFAAGWRKGRDPEADPPRFSRHVQIEGRLSVTGSKADERLVVDPREMGRIAREIASRISARANVAVLPPAAGPCSVSAERLDAIAERLWETRTRSLVVCGSQDPDVQVAVNLINDCLGSNGSTADLERPSLQRHGDDAELARLRDEIRERRVQALFIHGVNPLFDLPQDEALLAAWKAISLLVSFSRRSDETTSLATYICPDHHSLESWGDSEAVAGFASITQPAIQPLWNTRSVAESLAAWLDESASAYDIVRRTWSERIHPRAAEPLAFESFWEKTVRDGGSALEGPRAKAPVFDPAAVRVLGPGETPSEGQVLVGYPKVAILDGGHDQNPWLQELPDPITKVAWDNYACLSVETARRLSVRDGDIVRVEVPQDEGGNPPFVIELPALVQPGQHDAVIAIALGYGGAGTARFAKIGPRWLEARSSVGADGRVGKNIAPAFPLGHGPRRPERDRARIVPAGGSVALACTQEHHSIESPKGLALPGAESRPIVREMTLGAALPGSAETGAPDESPAEHKDLWPDDHPYVTHRWGMAVDLTACTGCSACVIACQAENNIPVVGKDEVRRKRSMQWMRIDRYYRGEGTQVGVVHQPMFCQQCAHAPCETVCPVLATVHSEEGLNEQVYNRCVGTRYCANNCPYKVRRFNWFKYRPEDPLQDLTLNPDVTVRSRGVMEKCTFCVQRIREAKLTARQLGRDLRDGEIRTACQQTCPSRAIVFGDMNDPGSAISRLLRSGRAYQVLAELNVQPSVTYLACVRHSAGGVEGPHHA